MVNLAGFFTVFMKLKFEDERKVKVDFMERWAVPDEIGVFKSMQKSWRLRTWGYGVQSYSHHELYNPGSKKLKEKQKKKRFKFFP